MPKRATTGASWDMVPNLHVAVLPPVQRRLFRALTQQPWISEYYLAGGTALALYLGHRRSVDFDFFTPHALTREILRTQLMGLGAFELLTEAHHSIEGTVAGVRVSFFTYAYPLLKPLLTCGHVRLADLLDIAVMKLDAISGRGSRKDFVDLYYLLRCHPLPALLASYEQKYGISLTNQYHLLKSLVYFADAENDPMPRMTRRLAWTTVKKAIIAAVREAGI